MYDREEKKKSEKETEGRNTKLGIKTVQIDGAVTKGAKDKKIYQ